VDLGRLNFLVLDEADRMVERGHFRELHDIIDTLPIPPRIKRPPGAAKATPETLKVFKSRGKADPGKDPAPRGKKGGKGQKGGNAAIVDTDIVQEEEDGGLTGFNLRPSQILDRQTFVFSATLTVPDTVRRKLKKRHANAFAGPDDKKKAASGANAGTLASLMEAVPFYGRVKLVDLTDQSQTVAKGVSESSLECTEVSDYFTRPLFVFPSRPGDRRRDETAVIKTGLRN
jgi:ATP-dependent RNA helicase DDX24/MAK5